MMKSLAAALALACWAPAMAESVSTAGPEHRTASGFANPWPSRPRGFGTFLKWRLGLGPDESAPLPAESTETFAPRVAAPDLKAIAKPDAGKIQVTWVGHSTVLLQMAGMNILTDPVFGDRASPVGFAGPARLSPPGLPMDALPAIDLVLVSHDHYDHLDKTTIRRLAGEPKYLVPLGLRTWFDGQGIASADELDWWQGAAVGPLEIWCVPARHFSGRNPFRQDRTLWCGWIIRGGGRTVYFAGDTGFSPHFMEIRRRFGPMDVSFLPIGAYRPRWFMEPMHLDPPQAVQAHAILGSGRSIPIHWGTFRQSREPMAEPPLYLRSSMVAAGLDPGCFSALDFGQTISIDL